MMVVYHPTPTGTQIEPPNKSAPRNVSHCWRGVGVADRQWDKVSKLRMDLFLATIPPSFAICVLLLSALAIFSHAALAAHYHRAHHAHLMLVPEPETPVW